MSDRVTGLQEFGLQKVRLSKDDLLTKVIANRKQHVEDYAEALDGYKEAFSQALEEKIVSLENGEVPDQYFRELPVPTHHEDDYDHVIAMLGFSLDDEIELTREEFAKYVMDDWGWKQNFTSNVGMYTNFKTKG